MADWRREARKAAQRHGINPAIFERQIGSESGFNPNARSPAGAQGIAQIMPATARGWGVDPHDPHAALDAAAKNMAGYIRKYGNWKDALVAYNAGPGRVGGALPRETRAYISKILGGQNPSAGASVVSRSEAPRSRTIPGTPASSKTDTAGALVDSLLAQKPLTERKPGSGGLLSATTERLSSGAYTTTTPGTAARVVQSAGSTGGGVQSNASDGLVQKLVSRANSIDKKKMPYLWGGGHGGKVDAHNATPLDCSGAVSAVLGVNPRVSGEFTKWGKPGAGGRVTVYANGKHVFMQIDGHFFGTSASNPAGGAGWIPREKMSPAYLKGFTARHI